MALTTCPECGKEVSSSAEKCPECGYPFTNSKSTQVKMMFVENKKHLMIGAAVLLAIVAIVLFQRTYLNEYEQMALSDCQTIKGMLKNPASFTLYDDILIYPDDETYGDLVYISYGATNSFGAMIQSMAIFEDGDKYVGNSDDTEEDFSSQHEYDYFLLAQLPYKYDIQIKGNYENFIRVDADKIMSRLD